MKLKIKLLFIGVFLGSLVMQVFAQTNFVVTGSVKNKTTGEALVGASVVNDKTHKSTLTNEIGKFTISAEKGATLTITYIGMSPFKYKVNSANEVTIAMEEDIKKNEEVIVVGYGTQKVTKVSGAISTIKSADIEKLKPVRAEDALQGRAAGVTVVNQGSPGAKPNVLIRGIPSYSGSGPLVVVDGVPQTLDDLNAINSADIESINVLKDAATTAIYGVKGGNGVILITTKSGRKNKKTEFNFSSNYGIQKLARKIGVLNATEYGAIVNEGSLADGGIAPFLDLSKLGVGTNWQDQVFNDAPLQSHSITARGGSDNVSYFVSGAFLGQDGVVGGRDKSFFNRYTSTANFSIDLTPKLKLISNTSFVNIKGAKVAENAINSVVSNALNFDPTLPVYNIVPNTVGTYSVSNNILSENYNPLTQLENTYNKSNTNKLYGKLELQYEFTKSLKFTSRYGYTNSDVTGKDFYPLQFLGTNFNHAFSTLNADGSTYAGAHNTVSQYKNTYYSYTLENFANYNFKISRDNSFETVLGISMSKNTGNAVSGAKKDVSFNSWDFAEVFAANGTNATSTITTSRYERRNLSYFGRINYDYQEKYIASLLLRRDGSYAFGDKNKFGNFYATALGWVVSSEKFFKAKLIQYLKIRGSLGITGNENVSPQTQQVSTIPYTYGLGQNVNYAFGSDPASTGAALLSYKNDVLQWEKQKQLNVGIDLRILNNKISITADYYEKNVSQLLFQPALSLYLGASQKPDVNIGTMQTKGIDFNISYTDVLSKSLKVNTSLSFGTAKNLVKDIGSSVPLPGGNYGVANFPVTRFEKGFTPAYFYGYKTAGLFQSQEEINKSATQPNAKPGDIKFVDINNSGIINDSDRTKIGDPYPKFTIGYNLSIEYKNFDFTTFLYASIGNDIYRAYERGLAFTNKPRNVLSRWTGQGSTNDARSPRTTFSDLNSNSRVSDRYVEDGSFLRIKDIQLGYTIPASAFKNKLFNKIRIYTQVKNALTLTKYSGYDPEITVTGDGNTSILETGIDRGNYPQTRIYCVGIDLKF